MSEYIDITDLGLDDDSVRPAEGGGFDPPEEGEYVLEITGCEAGVSQKSGKRTLCFKQTVVANADGSPTNEAGKDFKQWFSLGGTDFSKRRLKNMLMAIDAELSGFSPDAVIGRRFAATVFHEDYDKEDSEGNVRTFQNARTKSERCAS